MRDHKENRLEPASKTAWIATPPGSGPRFFWEWHRRLSQTVLSIPADVFHASDLYSLPAAVKGARHHKAKCSYDARELYAHVVSTIDRPVVSSFWRHIERTCIRKCHATFTVSDSIAEHIAKTYSVKAPTVVENVPHYRAPKGQSGGIGLRSRLTINDNNVLVIHQGQMRPYRGCEVLVRAIPDVDELAHFVFIGSGPLKPRLNELSRSLRCARRVHFIDPLPPEELLHTTAEADIGVTLLEDVCLNHRYALPNKLFEYLAAGVPVLGTDLPEIGNVIRRFDVGLVCQPGDAIDTASKLNRMVVDEHARRQWGSHTSTVFETINWQTASQRMVESFNKMIEADV